MGLKRMKWQGAKQVFVAGRAAGSPRKWTPGFVSSNLLVDVLQNQTIKQSGHNSIEPSAWTTDRTGTGARFVNYPMYLLIQNSFNSSTFFFSVAVQCVCCQFLSIVVVLLLLNN